jgi:hypothetical protein
MGNQNYKYVWGAHSAPYVKIALRTVFLFIPPIKYIYNEGSGSLGAL